MCIPSGHNEEYYLETKKEVLVCIKNRIQKEIELISAKLAVLDVDKTTRG